MAVAIDLLDVNVWLALTVADHTHHDRARQYWEKQSSDQFAFCRVTALGFLRLCTNPKVMGGSPYTIAEAWRAYAAFRQLPEVVLALEPPDCERILENWALVPGMTFRIWTDAYLAAFALASGMRLVSFDRDFARFESLDFLRLE